MENVEQHIEKVTSLLDDLDLNCKCKFSAWCANAILLEPTIKNTLFEITKSNATYQMLQAIIQACWYDYKSTASQLYSPAPRSVRYSPMSRPNNHKIKIELG